MKRRAKRRRTVLVVLQVGSWTLSGPRMEVEVNAAAIVELARVPKVPPAWVHPTAALGFQRPDTDKQRELGESRQSKVPSSLDYPPSPSFPRWSVCTIAKTDGCVCM